MIIPDSNPGSQLNVGSLLFETLALKERYIMPSKSPKQARTMAAAAHNPAFAKKVGIPQKVAKEFNKADKKKGKR
jgi:hypothetical protein